MEKKVLFDQCVFRQISFSSLNLGVVNFIFSFEVLLYLYKTKAPVVGDIVRPPTEHDQLNTSVEEESPVEMKGLSLQQPSQNLTLLIRMLHCSWHTAYNYHQWEKLDVDSSKDECRGLRDANTYGAYIRWKVFSQRHRYDRCSTQSVRSKNQKDSIEGDTSGLQSKKIFIFLNGKFKIHIYLVDQYIPVAGMLLQTRQCCNNEVAQGHHTRPNNKKDFRLDTTNY